jgi:glycosyltransferase involved in cell wall biosynthesis
VQHLDAAVLAIIPAHNEGGRIGSVVSAVAAQGLPVLVVDDGSTDETGKEAAAAGAQVLRLEPNRGKGAALKAGFRSALGSAGEVAGRGDSSGAAADGPAVSWAAVLTLDGDGQHDPAEIPKFLEAWRRTDADLVIGMRDYRHMPPIRWFTNSVSRLLFSRAVGEHIPDNQSGYRLHGRRIAEAALASEEQGFAFEVEEIAICVGRGYRLAWVPIKTIYGTEKSDIKPWAHFRSFMRVTGRARARVKAERRAAAAG